MKLGLIAVLAIGTLTVPANVVPAVSPELDIIHFESAGVRVGQDCITGDMLGLRNLEHSSLLVSGNAVETLSSEVAVALPMGRQLRLAPGVRVNRTQAGFELRAHDGVMVQVVTEAGRALVLGSPVAFSVSEEGWVLAGQNVEGSVLQAGLAVSMEDQERRRRRAGTPQGQPRRRGDRGQGQRRLFTESVTAQSFTSSGASLGHINDVSPTGFVK